MKGQSLSLPGDACFGQQFVLPLRYFCGRTGVGHLFKPELPKLHTCVDICRLLVCVGSDAGKKSAL